MNISEKVFLVAFAFLTACSSNEKPVNKQLVAQIDGHSLFVSDIQEEFKSRNPEQLDSVKFYKAYTERWLKHHLLVKLVEQELTQTELNVSKELEEYRQELIIHKFNEKNVLLLAESNLTEVELQRYYNKNQSLFVLDEPIAKAIYLIFPKETVLSQRFKHLIFSDNENDIATNEDFIFKTAKKYDNFNNRWVYLENLLRFNNEKNSYNVDKILNNKVIEFYSGTDLHFIAIKHLIEKGKVAPFEFVEPQIRSMIINRKKIDFLREIKDSLYQDALKYNKFSVFNK